MKGDVIVGYSGSAVTNPDQLIELGRDQHWQSGRNTVYQNSEAK